jgi:hypothetical protein
MDCNCEAQVARLLGKSLPEGQWTIAQYSTRRSRTYSRIAKARKRAKRWAKVTGEPVTLTGRGVHERYPPLPHNPSEYYIAGSICGYHRHY